MKQIDKNRETVLITGASTGIGYELSKIFAQNGYELIIVARDLRKLKEVEKELKEKYGTQVIIINKDLSYPNSAYELYEEVLKLDINIDILVNNAGAGASGLFHEIDYDKDIKIIQLNITSLTNLTKLVSKMMIENKSGKILNVASTGAYQPGPYTAVYYATKAYVLSFSEAIYNELKDYGITVTTICPGATKSEFSKRAGKTQIKGSMEAKKVALAAFLGLKKNKRLIIPGIQNKIAIIASKLLPGNITAKAVRKIQDKLINEVDQN